MERPLFEALSSWESGMRIFIDSKAPQIIAQEFDMDTRNRKPIAPSVQHSSLASALRTRTDPELTLDMIDWALAHLNDMQTEKLAHAVERTLESSGSKWMVGERKGFRGLQERVSPSTKRLAEKAFEAHQGAGELLAEAWDALYGRSPDYESAYAQSIKAIEEALLPVVEPANSKGTLGSTLNVLRNQNWRVHLQPGDSTIARQALVSPLAAVWHGQLARHGANGYRKPTRHESETAVLTAISVVHMIDQGLLIRETDLSAR